MPPSNSAKNPCRLFVILARKAPKAIIIRRGPSRWVQLILWNTADDTFEYGQWFHGRIYEHRCDLSPDATKFIYFAGKISRYTLQDTGENAYTTAWTAVSRPPYMTALALWPKGDTWYGGGLFLDNDTVLLNHQCGEDKPHPEHIPTGLQVFSIVQGVGEQIYYNRLTRDGWEVTQEGVFTNWDLSSGQEVENPQIWQKRHPRKPYKIEMRFVGFNLHSTFRTFNFALFSESLDAPTVIAGHEWADWDHRGRLAFVDGGKLFAVQPEKLGTELTELADFNSQMPTPRPSPEWARHW